MSHINPDHYKESAPLEVWEIMLNTWGKEAFIAYCQMNAFKYRMRAGKKEGQPFYRDILKAEWYEQKVREL